MSRSKLLGAALALPLMFAGATSAQAAIIALVIDSSGSIGVPNFNAQKQGYINAINALVTPNGLNTIGVWQFSDNVVQEFALTTISTAAQKTALINAISNMSYLNGQTSLGDAIQVARQAIVAFGGSGSKIIDVSTDGVDNDSNVTPTSASPAVSFSAGSGRCSHQ